MTRLLSLALVLCAAPLVSAAECPHCGCVDCQTWHWQRAGKPTCVHRFAIPSNTLKYSGGIVGGGAAFGGEDPYVEEGTWGWDYAGLIPIKRVWLGWSHKHYEAGGGKYDTDRRKRR